ncbi:hypothetical protein DID88_009536, partial [Monilinia fructigena]
NSSPERRKSSVQEERKRGQRLFGGLLNTLNQSTPNGQQKNSEVEARQKERAAQRKAEAEDRKKEKIANLKAIRVVEQVKFQEGSMRIRHTNMLAMAQFLSTETEPKLYYKPWLLSVRNEATIKSQVEAAEVLIEEEKSEWAHRHPEARLMIEEKLEVKVKTEKDHSEENNGEVVVEAEEDTVIY